MLPNIDESYPPTLSSDNVAEHIACKKAEAYKAVMHPDDLIITADTVVIVDNRILGKPHNAEEAIDMLKAISGKTHRVVTGVSITTSTTHRHFSVATDVTFASLSDEEIEFYVTRFKPFDKAGAYGIQEWIGLVAVEQLNGSFFNVMGLPVQRLYTLLKTF